MILFTETIVGQKRYKTEKSCETIKSFLFKENEKSHRMVEIIFNSNDSINDCFVYGNRNIAEEVISKKLCQPKVVYVERKTLSEWALKCSQWLSNAMKSGNIDTYSDEDFPEEYNNKIDRNFFDGIVVTRMITQKIFKLYTILFFQDIPRHKVVWSWRYCRTP